MSIARPVLLEAQLRVDLEKNDVKMELAARVDHARSTLDVPYKPPIIVPVLLNNVLRLQLHAKLILKIPKFALPVVSAMVRHEHSK